MRLMQRRRRERAPSSWPTTENNGVGMELVGTGDEADEVDQPGDADKREDGHEGHEHEQSFMEEIQTSRDAGKSSDVKVGGAESALLFEDDENKSAMLDSEVVSTKFSLRSFLHASSIKRLLFDGSSY